jgi:tripartite-type tricarboxylate transporter receptor subunit TctC
MNDGRAGKTGAIAGAIASVLLLGVGSAAAANCPEGYPSKPINFYVGFAAGGGTDAIGRSIASSIEQANGWTIVVENKPGAASGVMNLSLKSMAADGYHIGVSSSESMVWNPTTGDLGYKYDDFEYLGSAMDSWNSFVALSTAPFDDIASFAEYAREKGIATVSVAGFNQALIVEQLAKQYGVNIVAVPGAGASESMMSALGGHVDATMQATLHIPELKSGNMKQLASLTNRRLPYAPDSATLEEQGAEAIPIVSATTFITPKGLDPAIKTCLQEVIDAAVKTPEFKALTDKYDNEPVNLGEVALIEQIVTRDALFRELSAAAQ